MDPLARPRPVGLSIKEENGWRIQWQADGVDYPSLLNDFRQGLLPGDRLSTGSPDREVYRVAPPAARLPGGPARRLVIKRDREFDTRLEKRLWDWLGGTQYSRLIRFTNRAVNEGCRLIQDIYLVAEKMEGGRCREAWLIAEYVEGEAFIQQYVDGRASKAINYRHLVPDMARAMGELHDWGLAANDFHPGNFVLTESGDLRIIDLAMDGPMLICQANDALTMMHFYKIRPPLRSWRLRLVYALMSFWRWQKNKTRSLRRKIKAVFKR